MRKKCSIFYINYSPYENAGNILDFLLQSFEFVFLISLDFHAMRKEDRNNKLFIFYKGKLKYEYKLFKLTVSSKLVFVFLPIRSLINFIQILLYAYKVKKKYGKINIFFSVNGFIAWIGLILKKLGIVNQTIYWVWDYYPINHKNKLIQLMRWVYWQFDKIAARSDIVCLQSKRLVKIWRKKRINFKGYKLIPIGTSNKNITIKTPNFTNIKMVFLGVLKKSQGLDYIFDAAQQLQWNYQKIELRILGSGPDIEYFKNRAKETGLKTYFYGFVSERKIDKIISESTIGIAPYTPDPSSVSYYGDPGKIKRYISLGLPVIATDTHEFSKELEKHKAGVLVQYGNVKALIHAVQKIVSCYAVMSRNVANLNNKFSYKELYFRMFHDKL